MHVGVVTCSRLWFHRFLIVGEGSNKYGKRMDYYQSYTGMGNIDMSTLFFCVYVCVCVCERMRESAHPLREPTDNYTDVQISTPTTRIFLNTILH